MGSEWDSYHFLAVNLILHAFCILGEKDSRNVLDSIHNCVYFAVAVLQEIQRCEVIYVVTPSISNSWKS